MKAITVRDHDAGVGGMSLAEIPYPRVVQNDVIVKVHAAGFTTGELDWTGTWATALGATGHRVCPATSYRAS